MNEIEKTQLLGMTPDELAAYLKALGQPAFRAKQVFSWLHQGAAFEQMSNLPKALRETLAETCTANPVAVLETIESKLDGTIKLLYRLPDGHVIEGVLMRYKYGNTLCLSTQVGCRMGCAFCASTLDGCARSLTPAEMLGQIVCANGVLAPQGQKVGNIVLMGSGEPLDNYDNVVKFLRILRMEGGLCIGMRSVSLSTCGLVENMRRFAQEDLPVTLSLSLHAPNDEVRKKLMPVARKYGMDDVLDACRYYIEKTGRRVIFEYALVHGVNADPAQAVPRQPDSAQQRAGARPDGRDRARGGCVQACARTEGDFRNPPPRDGRRHRGRVRPAPQALYQGQQPEQRNLKTTGVNGVAATMRTDIGKKRKQNEDAAWFDEKRGVFVVADGMGGHLAGEVASGMAIDAVRKMAARHKKPSIDQIKKAVLGAHERIYQRAQGNAECAGMGTTLSMLCRGAGYIYIAHVGDSRIYRLRGGRMEQLTQDHSLVGELVRAGILTAEEARTHPRRNIITRALGTEGDNTPDLLAADLQPGDRFLLCTDGLTGMTRDDEIEKTLLDSQTADEAADRLIQMALDAGGSDNVTLILCTGEEGKPWKQD